MATACIDKNMIGSRAEMFKALSDPVRLELLVRIAGVDEMACTDLVNEAHVTASTVSYHVRILKAAGLVAVRKEGRNYHYTIEPEAFRQLQGFAEHLLAEHAR